MKGKMPAPSPQCLATVGARQRFWEDMNPRPTCFWVINIGVQNALSQDGKAGKAETPASSSYLDERK